MGVFCRGETPQRLTPPVRAAPTNFFIARRPVPAAATPSRQREVVTRILSGVLVRPIEKYSRILRMQVRRCCEGDCSMQ